MTPNPPPDLAFKPTAVTVDGARLSMHIGGSGQPLVLFHSLLADRTSFDLVAGELARTHQVIALSLPGFDDSDAAPGDLEAVADRVARGLGALALAKKPILLGNGYGGFVALQAVIRHPELAAALVLADSGAAFSEPGRAAFRGMSAAAEKGGLASIADVAMRRLFAPDFQAANPELMAQRKAGFLRLAPATFHAACAALATLDLRPQLASVQLPALVLVGEMDEATPPPMSHELAAGLPRAQLKVLPGCAHVPQMQAPQMFLDALADFLAAQRAA